MCWCYVHQDMQCPCTYVLAYSCTMTHNAVLHTYSSSVCTVVTVIGLLYKSCIHVYTLQDLFVMATYKCTLLLKLTHQSRNHTAETIQKCTTLSGNSYRRVEHLYIRTELRQQLQIIRLLSLLLGYSCVY